MKKITIALCFILPFLFSCNSKAKKEDQEIIEEEPFLDPDYNYIHLIPDSLRTPEQNEFLMELQSLIMDNIRADKHKMEFVLSEEEFVAKGFPKEYYILIQKNIVENNKYFKENNIQNVDSIINDSWTEFK